MTWVATFREGFTTIHVALFVERPSSEALLSAWMSDPQGKGEASDWEFRVSEGDIEVFCGGLESSLVVELHEVEAPHVDASVLKLADFLIEWAVSGDDLRDWTGWDEEKLDLLKASVGIATHIGCPGGFCRLTFAGRCIAELLRP